MRTIAIAVAAAALLAPAQGMAASKKSPAAEASDPAREICKSKPVVGSRLKRIRECHSAAEWEDMELAEQIGLQRQQINGAQGQSPAELNMIGRIEAAQQPQ